MYSQGGSGPHAAAAAGATNGGDGATQKCKDENCMNLRKVCNAAIKQRKDYRDELKKYDRKENYDHVKKKNLHETEQALKLFLAGCLADKPVPHLDVKFDAWRRRSNDVPPLTPHEKLYYGLSCHKSKQIMQSERCHIEYNHGVEFLHDLVSKDFLIERRVPVFMKLKKTAHEVACEKKHCQEMREIAIQVADDLRKTERECRDHSMKDPDHVLECRALMYALKMLVCVHKGRSRINCKSQIINEKNLEHQSPVVVDILREKLLKKTTANIKEKKDQSQPIPIKLEKKANYKEAVRCVRALLWHEGLPSEDEGKKFIECVEKSDYGKRLRPSAIEWIRYKNSIHDKRRFITKKSDVLPSEPCEVEQRYWEMDHLELTSAIQKEEEEREKRRERRLKKGMGSEERMKQQLQPTETVNPTYDTIDNYYQYRSRMSLVAANRTENSSSSDKRSLGQLHQQQDQQPVPIDQKPRKVAKRKEQNIDKEEYLQVPTKQSQQSKQSLKQKILSKQSNASINSLSEEEKDRNRRRDDGNSSNETNETSPDNK